MNKNEIRSEIKKSVLANKDLLPAESEKICSGILNSSEYQSAELVFSYMPLWDEVDVSLINDELFLQGKKLALPRIKSGTSQMDFCLFRSKKKFEQGLQKGSFGISEPASFLQKIETEAIKEKVLILVPGRAFTLDGRRLGRGKGFYDRFLCKINKKENFTLAGVCFSFQILDDIPTNENDILMQKIFYGSSD